LIIKSGQEPDLKANDTSLGGRTGIEQHYLMLLGPFVTVARTAWYNREAQNLVLAAVAVLALLALWACYQLGPDREDDNSTKDE
jgi:hypothetical protein